MQRRELRLAQAQRLCEARRASRSSTSPSPSSARGERRPARSWPAWSPEPSWRRSGGPWTRCGLGACAWGAVRLGARAGAVDPLGGLLLLVVELEGLAAAVGLPEGEAGPGPGRNLLEAALATRDIALLGDLVTGERRPPATRGKKGRKREGSGERSRPLNLCSLYSLSLLSLISPTGLTPLSSTAQGTL